MGKSLRQANDYWQDQPDCYELLSNKKKTLRDAQTQVNERPPIVFRLKIALTIKRISSFSLYSVNHTGAQSLPSFVWKKQR